MSPVCQVDQNVLIACLVSGAALWNLHMDLEACTAETVNEGDKRGLFSPCSAHSPASFVTYGEAAKKVMLKIVFNMKKGVWATELIEKAEWTIDVKGELASWHIVASTMINTFKQRAICE